MNDAGVSEIWVFAVGHHSHLAGRSIRTRHFRNGVEMPEILSEKTYDFNFQQYRLLPKPVRILPVRMTFLMPMSISLFGIIKKSKIIVLAFILQEDELVIECGLSSKNRNFTTVVNLTFCVHCMTRNCCIVIFWRYLLNLFQYIEKRRKHVKVYYSMIQ